MLIRIFNTLKIMGMFRYDPDGLGFQHSARVFSIGIENHGDGKSP